MEVGLLDCPPLRPGWMRFVLGEPLGPELYLGAVLVAAGSYLVQRKSV